MEGKEERMPRRGRAETAGRRFGLWAWGQPRKPHDGALGRRSGKMIEMTLNSRAAPTAMPFVLWFFFRAREGRGGFFCGILVRSPPAWRTVDDGTKLTSDPDEW